ncbi:carboxypeptidase-like regulatory domain-containing protein [Lacipirellula parvula]|uniref:Carboxypeptidase regulatory-like domain-containing protein n=1 Tax=Lacipirellula parvula TaxID=2650471 RepID=A0A5K7X9F8_9BACT|nr:carboxypeptidase-like regulatory domain-containing protein [Lacipirellula parvula]BBO33340.1 hypothetical protein PLANPX_2952 [Lacipirellula parvula]
MFVNSQPAEGVLRLRSVARCALAIIVIGIAGCSDANFSTVSGRVSLNGASLDGGAITFIPEAAGPLAYGNVAPDGTYSLQSSGGVEGLRPGNYTATVSYRSGRPSPGMTLAQIQALEKVPISYTTPETSDLKKEVKAGDNQIDLELVSKS